MTKSKTKKSDLKTVEEPKKETVVEHRPEGVKFEDVHTPEPVVVKEPPPIVFEGNEKSDFSVTREIPAPAPVIKKDGTIEADEMKFLRTLAYTQFHGGRGTYLNEMIIGRAKAVLKTDSVFIENGEIIN
jgi:hypothetical protein